MTNVINSTFCLNKIRPKLIKNCINTSVITGSIVKYKIFKFIFEVILLNDLYNLLSNNFVYI